MKCSESCRCSNSQEKHLLCSCGHVLGEHKFDYMNDEINCQSCGACEKFFADGTFAAYNESFLLETERNTQ